MAFRFQPSAFPQQRCERLVEKNCINGHRCVAAKDGLKSA